MYESNDVFMSMFYDIAKIYHYNTQEIVINTNSEINIVTKDGIDNKGIIIINISDYEDYFNENLMRQFNIIDGSVIPILPILLIVV